MKLNSNAQQLFSHNIMDRDSAIDFVKNSQDAELASEVSRVLTVFQSGIHELSNGMKINATKDRLLGGAFFAAIGGKLMSLFAQKAVPALKAAAQAGWNSLTGQAPSDNEETNMKQLTLMEEKFNKLEGSLRKEMEEKLTKISQKLTAVDMEDPEAINLAIVDNVTKQLQAMDLPAKTESIKMDISNLSESSVFNMRSNVIKANNNEGMINSNVGKFVNSGSISFGAK